MTKKMVKSAFEPSYPLAHAELIPVLLSYMYKYSLVASATKEYFFSPLDGMLDYHSRLPSSIEFGSNFLYIWMERGTIRVKCLAQEHNMQCAPARANEPSLLNPGSRPTCLSLMKLWNRKTWTLIQRMKTKESNAIWQQQGSMGSSACATKMLS